jgi:7-cyano-7-deazaguanine synthase in queuosine biosynthesis
MNVLLYGGGFDSTALLFDMVHCGMQDIEMIHIGYGQKAYDAERKAARHFAQEYGVKLAELHTDLRFSKARIMEGTPIGEHAPHNRLELRNVVLLSLAASYAATKYDTHTVIYLGFHKEPADSTFLDAQTRWLASMAETLSLATTRMLTINTPFTHLTRDEILRVAINRDPSILTHSHTCYEAYPCGACWHCKEKERMIKTFDVENTL